MEKPQDHVSLGNHWQSWLAAISGAIIIIHGERLLGLISAFLMFTVRGMLNRPIIGEEFNAIIVVYGGISGLIESVVMIVTAIYIIKYSRFALTVALWAIPIFTIHAIVFLSVTGQLGLEVARSIAMSFILWIAFIYLSKGNKGDASQ